MIILVALVLLPLLIYTLADYTSDTLSSDRFPTIATKASHTPFSSHLVFDFSGPLDRESETGGEAC